MPAVIASGRRRALRSTLPAPHPIRKFARCPAVWMLPLFARFLSRGAETTGQAAMAEGRLETSRGSFSTGPTAVDQSDTDCDEPVFVHEATLAPGSSIGNAGYRYRTLSIRYVRGIVSFKPLSGGPVVAAKSLPASLLETTFKAVDRAPVLKPLESFCPLLHVAHQLDDAL